MLRPPEILSPCDVSLDTGCHAASSEGFADDVSGNFPIVVISDESIDNLVLVMVQTESDDLIGVLNVKDIILRGGPKREIILLSELTESLSGRF